MADSDLRVFLEAHAPKDRSWANAQYCEHDQTSDRLWIHRVGVFALYDANKMDWIECWVGIQRSPDREPEFLGSLRFPEGENDDCTNTIMRAVDCMGRMFAIRPFVDLPPFELSDDA